MAWDEFSFSGNSADYAGLYEGYGTSSDAATSVTSTGSNILSGWSSALQDALSLGTKTAAQLAIMKQQVSGQSYLEGQRLQAAALQSQLGLNTGTLILLFGGAALLMFLLKD